MKIIIVALLCLQLTSIISSQDFHTSWLDPATICSNEPFIWSQFGPTKDFPDPEYNTCIKPFENISQVWFRFRIKNVGDVAFILSPIVQNTDLDFALFSSKAGMPVTDIRCIATGLNIDGSKEDQKNCMGQTGLSTVSQDTTESSGCDPTKDNFLASYTGQAGDEFLLLITNYRSSSGFAFVWTGTADIDEKLCKSEKDIINDISIQVNPNPTTSSFFCTIESPEEKLVDLYIVNSNGAQLLRKNISLLPGENSIPVTERNFQPGHFYVILKHLDEIIAYTNFEIVK